MQWARIYVGYGWAKHSFPWVHFGWIANFWPCSTRSLDIKELKTFYNEHLDIDETVGAYFDDRKDPDSKSTSDEPPSNSIVRVYRLTPDPREFDSTVRFGSVMPESTARPRKRLHATSAQSPQNTLRAVTSIEEHDDALPKRTFTVANKRQKTHEARTSEVPRSDRPHLSQGHGEEGIHIASQTAGTQGSIHQVYDSQGSSAKKSTCLL